MLQSILQLIQEFKATTATRIDRIERLMIENVTGHDTVKTEDMKQQKESLQSRIIRLGWNQNPYSM